MILSNGSEAQVGATFAPWELLRRVEVDRRRRRRAGVVALETAIRGTCEPARLLDLVENFVAYIERPGGLVKALARYHQYFGVNAAIEALAADPRDGREAARRVLAHAGLRQEPLDAVVHAEGAAPRARAAGRS